MKQTEMSRYLKAITIGVGALLLVFVCWFLPLVLKEPLEATAGERGYQAICIVIALSALPAFLCLIRFWGICDSISKDQSFSEENAWRLKRMSQYMLLDMVLYTGLLLWFFVAGWYQKVVWMLFPVLLAIFISLTLTIVCAVLSHLVQRASEMQKEQELTI